MHSNLVIIGGGPAASAAALLALDSGLTPTVIYPKKKQIDNKPFQSLYPDIIKLLKLIRCEGPLDASKCGRYSFISINGQKTPLSNYKEIPDVGYHINRYRFDQFLLEEVKKRGGNIIHGNAHHFIFDKAGRISGIFTDEGKEIATDFIIDASGVRRFSGKQLKLEEQYFSPEFIVTTGQVSISPVLQEEQIFEFHTEEKGWHWIVAAENTYTWTKLTLKGQQNSRPPNSLEKYKMVGQITAQNMTWRKFRNLSLPGLALVGDAACVIDPASGQGVHTAILSGIKAVQELLCKKSKSPLILTDYEKWFNAYFEAKCKELANYYKQLGLEPLLLTD